MDIDIRSYINDNFTNNTKDELEESILESIKSQDEEILPGLGVFFEIIWSNSNNNLKEEILKILENNFKSN